MFQNLRVNSPVYILHKENSPYIEQGNVISVSMPKPKYPSQTQFGQYPQMEMVVDVVVNIGGQNANLQGLPAGADIADFGQNGNIVVSCSRDAMNGELSTLRQKSVDILNSVEYHKGMIESCDKMLTALNPEFAAKQQQEQEIDMMKQQIATMTQNMNTLMQMNQKLMEQLGVSENDIKKQ